MLGGSDTLINGYEVITWMTAANITSTGRAVLIVKHKDGIYIEAGCFSGNLADLVAKATAEGKPQYVKVIEAIASVL